MAQSGFLQESAWAPTPTRSPTLVKISSVAARESVEEYEGNCSLDAVLDLIADFDGFADDFYECHQQPAGTD